jgi:hypothetical protein
VDPVRTKKTHENSLSNCLTCINWIVQKNERVIIYTNRSDEIRHKLVDSIEDVKKRYGANKQADRQPLGDLSASYLDDEEEDDFLGTWFSRSCKELMNPLFLDCYDRNRGRDCHWKNMWDDRTENRS